MGFTVSVTIVETKQHQYNKAQKHHCTNRTARGPAVRLLMLSNYILLCCAFVAVETRQHPLPGIGSQCAGLPCVANGIIVATLSMVPRWRLYRYVRLCVCSLVVCWLPMVLSCVRRQYTYTIQALLSKNTTLRARACISGPTKKMRYMREYMPENQVTKCVQTPPEPRKGVYQDALGYL